MVVFRGTGGKDGQVSKILSQSRDRALPDCRALF
jgi:hypothetical protein